MLGCGLNFEFGTYTVRCCMQGEEDYIVGCIMLSGPMVGYLYLCVNYVLHRPILRHQLNELFKQEILFDKMIS